MTRPSTSAAASAASPPHFAIVLDGDIHSFPQIDYTDSTLSDGISGGAQITGLRASTEAKNLALVLQTGALPDLVQADRAKRRLRDSRQGLAERGEDRRADRALIVGSSCSSSTGSSAWSRSPVSRSTPPFLYAAVLLLNVTMTLPGFAGLILTIGVAADATSSSSTHQGRGARRQVDPRRDADRLPEGLPHDHRRERRDGDHGARAVRGRDRAGEGLRADAADRHRDLAGHRRRRDAARCSAFSPVSAGSTTRASSAPRSSTAEVPADRLHAPAVSGSRSPA